MATAYNRYERFKRGGEMKLAPFIEIPVSPTDRYDYYIQGQTRLDIMSNTHYKDPNYGWLILQANPQLSNGLEFMIETGKLIRIPYPLQAALALYEQGIKKYEELYGIG